jgi:hypothetical protein
MVLREVPLVKGQAAVYNTPMSTSGTETVLCPGCSAEGPLRRDKYQRPYWRCFLCGISIFLRTTASEAGFWVMQSIIRKMSTQYKKATYALTVKLDRERGAAGQARAVAATSKPK